MNETQMRRITLSLIDLMNIRHRVTELAKELEDKPATRGVAKRLRAIVLDVAT